MVTLTKISDNKNGGMFTVSWNGQTRTLHCQPTTAEAVKGLIQQRGEFPHDVYNKLCQCRTLRCKGVERTTRNWR